MFIVVPRGQNFCANFVPLAYKNRPYCSYFRFLLNKFNQLWIYHHLHHSSEL